MININITGRNFELDSKTKKYVGKKIGHLDRILPKPMRGGLKADVVLTETDSQPNERFRCEVRMHMPHEGVYASEATVVNMHTAIDMAEQTIRQQINKYKDKKLSARQQTQRLVRRLKRFGRR